MPLQASLFSSPTTSLRPRLSDVQLVARSHEDVAAYTYFLRLSSRTIEKLSFSNRSGEQNFTFPGVPSILTHHRRRDTTYQSRGLSRFTRNLHRARNECPEKPGWAHSRYARLPLQHSGVVFNPHTKPSDQVASLQPPRIVEWSGRFLG